MMGAIAWYGCWLPDLRAPRAEIFMVADTLPSGAQLDVAVARLHELQIRIKTDSLDLPVEPSLTAKEEVLARFQPLFSADHLPLLTEEEFRSFLIFRNNRHWSGLQRLGPGIC